ncbi:AbrB/MazE/SpoVT family DNA-binding domain-containing protein [Streptomyces viridosporus]|uniref:AbrB/MazE/SpoVT family DNA-binding domain-containing protein n=1 Tax=Streptomyces viridosporus TaxID=67581 RepID=UPI00331FCD38
MLREPSEVEIDESGRVEIPMGVLVEAGLAPGARLLAYSTGDGRITLRRFQNALTELAETGTLS